MRDIDQPYQPSQGLFASTSAYPTTRMPVQPNPDLIREIRAKGYQRPRNLYEKIRSQVTILNDDDRTLLVHVAYVDPEFFVERYLLDPVVMSPLQPHHVRLLNLIPYDKTGVKVNVQAPRGSAKTTCCAIWYPLWRICFRDFQLAEGVPDEKFILIISRNESMAEKNLRDIKGLIDNPKIVQDFGVLRGPVWKKDECETANGVSLLPLGRNQSPRGALVHGKRPTLLVVDDLEDPKRCLNPNLRKEDLEWFFSDVLFASDIGGNINCIYSDTVKHPDSMSVRLAKTPGWKTVHFKAIPNPEDLYHPINEHLWKEWEEIYRDLTLDDGEREAKADEFYNANTEGMNSGVTALWPQALSYLKVRKMIVERGYHFCMRELQNIARDSSMSLFDMENAMTFREHEDGLMRKDGRIVEWSHISGFTTYIDTMGGRDVPENSYACAVVVVWEPLQGGSKLNPESMSGMNAYVLLCWLDRVPLTEQFEQGILLHQRAEAMLYKAVPDSKFFVEKPPDKDYTIAGAHRAAFKAMREKHRFEKMLGHHSQTQKKEARIETLEPAIKNGWLAFNEVGLPPELWKQFREFPTSDHNDAPDAVQGACRARVSASAKVRNFARHRDPDLEEWYRVNRYRTVRI